MKTSNNYYFCATGRSGLGHIRRLTNIVRELHGLQADSSFHLVCNASVDGLTDCERRLFASVSVVDRARMAAHLASHSPALVVVDTAVIPGIENLGCPLVLIMRETRDSMVAEFALGNGRVWDAVIAPNPDGHWQPDAAQLPSRSFHAVGWIYRAADIAGERPTESDQRTILVSASGGGKSTATTLYEQIDAMLKRVCEIADFDLVVRQLISPRGPTGVSLSSATEYLQSSPELHREYARHDLVISSAGYNSVLEIASSDVPCLLVPVDRRYDDQWSRAVTFAPLLGEMFCVDRIDSLLEWMHATLARRCRRRRVAIDSSGALRVAQLLKALVP